MALEAGNCFTVSAAGWSVKLQIILFITGLRENMNLKTFIKKTFRNICFIIRRKKEPVFRFLFINVPAGFSIYS